MPKEMKDYTIKQLIDNLQPYVNGKLITHVFVRFWEELKERIDRINIDCKLPDNYYGEDS